MPPSKVLFLTGAPNSCGLTWRDEELCETLLPSAKRFLENSPTGRRTVEDIMTSDVRTPWRALPLTRQHLPTGMSQCIPYTVTEGDPLFFKYQDSGVPKAWNTSFSTTASFSFVSDDGEEESNSDPHMASSAKLDDEILTQFYEHSFAVHEDIQSSQVIRLPETTSQQRLLDDSEDTNLTSCITDVDSTPIVSSSPATQRPKRVTPPIMTVGLITDLKNIPNASYLDSIIPQTMTVNLIVGLISIAPPRTIKTRRGGHEMEIVEILLGDETKAGFGINFWLSPTHQSLHAGECSLKQVLSQSRPQDVILIRNAALSSFRGKVFGQSLRKNLTKVDLLYRNIIDVHDDPGAYTASQIQEQSYADAHVAKTKKVRDWVMRFVGPTARSRSGGPAVRELPPDTQ